MPSLSRQLARWVADLDFKDLPPAVVDRAKGVTLHGLASALLGRGKPNGMLALELMKDEEAGAGGVATVLADGTRLTKYGAAFVNAGLISAGGKLDSYHMLTHPGRSVLPAALVAAESGAATGKEYITGVVAGYEVMERLAGDFIPSVMARGFHAALVFGIFGAAVAAAKMMRLNEDQLNSTIAQCVNLAAGDLEGARGCGHVGSVVRNALLAVALAKRDVHSGDTVLEGEAGFYYSYTGNNKGKLSYVFSGPKTTSLERITDGLGERWDMLDTAYRIYSTPGFNLAHVDVTAKLCEENDIRPEDVDRIEAIVNWMETLYPSPAFAKPGAHDRPRVGSSHYFSAYGVVKRGFPVLGIAGDLDDPDEVLDLMQRVTLIPSKTRAPMAPAITIYTKDGKKYRRKSSGREFMWDFNEQARRIRGVIPGVPISEQQFETLITACRDLDHLARADELIRLTIPG